MNSIYNNYLKRALDITAGSTILLCASPLLLSVALFLKIANKGSGAFFLQERPGRYGRIFRIVKFKTMTDECDADGCLLPDEQRLTRIGKWVRSLSIDELPQLVNVVKGDMSLIGPRPLLVDYLPLYSARQARRHEVRPGITGWAQVNGRNTVNWPKKFEMDVWYVDHLSFKLDMLILRQTVYKVVKRDGIASEGSVTMTPFRGNPK